MTEARMTAMDYLQDLESKILAQQKECIAIKRLLLSYPDLRLNHLLHSQFWCSAMANSQVTQVAFIESTGSGDGSYSLYARPFVEVDEVKIHSDPLEFILGSGYHDSGEDGSDSCFNVDDDWRSIMMKHNIPLAIIERCAAYIEEMLHDLKPSE